MLKMGFKMLRVVLILFSLIFKSFGYNEKFLMTSTVQPPCDSDDWKQAVSRLEQQLQLRTLLADLKENINLCQRINETVIKDMETLLDNKQKQCDAKVEDLLKNVKKEMLAEMEKRFQSFKISENLPTDCKDVQNRGSKTSGLYVIKPEIAKTSFKVWCDMETKGGGWTYVLNRFDGLQNFHLNWANYKHGFGNIAKESWLGLEHLYELTNSKANELLVELVDWNNKKVYANYKFFEIGTEAEGYNLRSLEDYSGDAGDCLHPDATNKPMFTTKDRDQDKNGGNCANVYPGAWWFGSCFRCHLMGKYWNEPHHNLTKAQYALGIHWYDYGGYYYSLKEARMMVRPQD